MSCEAAAGAFARSGWAPLMALAASIEASAEAFAFEDNRGTPLALLGCLPVDDGVGEVWLALGTILRPLRRPILTLARWQLQQWQARWPLLIGRSWDGAPTHGAYLRHLGFTRGCAAVIGTGIFTTYVKAPQWP